MLISKRDCIPTLLDSRFFITRMNQNNETCVEAGIKIHRKEPNNWMQTYRRLKEYRKNHLAPVDSMGCAELGEGTEKIKRFQTLLALMLSPQTRDEMTARAMSQVREYCRAEFDEELDLRAVRNTKQSDLEECIKCVGFYRTKSKNIKAMAEILHASASQDVPNTYEGLVELPGVGPKIAYLCLQYAWNRMDGIGVDVHVHRISNRLNWVKSKNPEDTRKQLEHFLPQEHWQDVNTILVGFGQTVCNARRPTCGECPVSELCPSANLQKVGTIIKSKRLSKKML
eukprot:NODE_349_length_10402_cov_0.251286.p4 type:complete len:284 gc:universal NODE_349_length_10402_cov_0.251286:466-1317(+)